MLEAPGCCTWQQSRSQGREAAGRALKLALCALAPQAGRQQCRACEAHPRMGPGQGMGLLRGSPASCYAAGAIIQQLAGAFLAAAAASGPSKHAGCRPGPPRSSQAQPQQWHAIQQGWQQVAGVTAVGGKRPVRHARSWPGSPASAAYRPAGAATGQISGARGTSGSGWPEPAERPHPSASKPAGRWLAQHSLHQASIQHRCRPRPLRGSLPSHLSGCLEEMLQACSRCCSCRPHQGVETLTVHKACHHTPHANAGLAYGWCCGWC